MTEFTKRVLKGIARLALATVCQLLGTQPKEVPRKTEKKKKRA